MNLENRKSNETVKGLGTNFFQLLLQPNEESRIPAGIRSALSFRVLGFLYSANVERICIKFTTALDGYLMVEEIR